MNLDAILLTYNPDILAFKKNLENTLSIFRTVHVFDNSSDNFGELYELCSKYRNIILNESPHNIGIAGLNILADQAFQSDADSITILDQDSNLPADFDEELAVAFASFDTGVFAPICVDSNNKSDLFSKIWQFGTLRSKRVKVDLNSDEKYLKTELAIGSGLSIRRRDWEMSGGFNESFFLDGADIEFCLKLRKLNIPIYYVNTLLMDHKIGSERERILGRYYVSMHDPYRHYLYFKALIDIVVSSISPWSFKLHYLPKLGAQYLIYCFLVSDSHRHRVLINKAIKESISKTWQN